MEFTVLCILRYVCGPILRNVGIHGPKITFLNHICVLTTLFYKRMYLLFITCLLLFTIVRVQSFSLFISCFYVCISFVEKYD